MSGPEEPFAKRPKLEEPSAMSSSNNNGNPPPPAPPSNNSTTSTSNTALNGKAGVCAIDIQSVEFNWRQPWQRLGQVGGSGTGFVIDGRRILTNAHVVDAAVDVRVRLLGSAKKFKANVWIQAPDVDLAILTLANKEEEEAFFYDKQTKQSIALQFSDVLPNLQERVQVCGFPTGGKTICVTEGVVSRIDVRSVSVDTRVNALSIQIDAAINSGNSGGPVFDKTGKVAGVAFQKMADKGSDNIGYIIAASTVKAFLTRCHTKKEAEADDAATDNNGKDGKEQNSNGTKESGVYTMAPSTPYRYTRLFNRSLRLAHKVPDHIEGVLLNSVSETAVEGRLKVGDVLTKVDDYQLESDGQIYFRGGDENLIQHEFVFAGKCYQEPVKFTVFRDGKLVECEPVVLHHISRRFTLYPEVDHREEYLFIGPALFVPASYGLIYQGKEPDSILKGSIKKDSYLWPHEWKNKDDEGTSIDQFVLLIKIMAHDASFDYKRAWSRVTEYNGVPVQSLKHLRDLWAESREIAEREAKEEEEKKKQRADDGDDKTETKKEEDPTQKEYRFARIGLECSEELVFEVNTAMEAEKDVMKAHNIPRPSVILPPNPKYVWT